MSATDYPIRHAPEIDAATFRAVLATGNSPALAEADAMYAALVAAGVSPLVFLGVFWVESKLGTTGIVAAYGTKNPGNVRTPEVAGTATLVQTPRGTFAKYPTWAAAARDWAARLTGPKYAGRGLATLRTVIPIYAPGTDSNYPDAYIAAVLARIAAWGGTAAQAAKGDTVATPTITPKLTTVNYWPGRNGLAPLAVVMHVAEGGKASTDSWFHSAASEASAHYEVNKDGSVWQYVREGDSAWANGPLDHPDTSNALIRHWRATGINPNRETISVETEGFHNEDMTPAQLASLCWLVADIHRRYGWPTDGSRLLGHYQFDSINRPNCPSFSASEWAALRAAIAAVGTSAKAPIEVITEEEGIVAKYVDKPGEGVFPGVNEAGEPFVVIKPGGQMKPGTVNVDIQDLGITGEGLDDAMYSRSIVGNAWQEYERHPKA